MADVLVWTTYVVASVIVVIYGLAACFVAFLRYCLSRPTAHCVLSNLRQQVTELHTAFSLVHACFPAPSSHAWGGPCRHRRVGPDTPEFFLTARNSVGTFRIAWSFYAAAMGSWTLFSPASYAWTAGQALTVKMSRMGPKMWKSGQEKNPALLSAWSRSHSGGGVLRGSLIGLAAMRRLVWTPVLCPGQWAADLDPRFPWPHCAEEEAQPSVLHRLCCPGAKCSSLLTTPAAILRHLMGPRRYRLCPNSLHIAIGQEHPPVCQRSVCC